ncbi:MAG: NADH-quinone oxidoreductase subunit NuoG [Acidimicrobiales bacterium]
MTDVSPRVTEESVTFTLNGKEVSARPGEQLIDACERNGSFIPRFCYHPRMTAVGKCRQCIVEVDTGRGMSLQPSCMLTVSEGMAVDTDSELAKQVQEGVLEHLLINHPLDCPVCDKGGECPLQDQAYSHGPGESRFVEQKRNFEKPIAISETVYLDRERCILCDRCTRFADEVAGDPLIHFIDRGNATQVNTFPDEPFSSYFSGNTVQICPVGALTAKPYRFKARPWDLEQAESTCQTCSVGCRVNIDTSRNRVLRVNGVDADPVNWGWLCDAGRFNFENIHHDDRLSAPLVRSADGSLEPASWSDALTAAADALRAGIDSPGSVAVLGGARLTNEDAYAWAKFAKGGLGTDHVDAQLGDGLPAEVVLGLPRATIDSTCAKGGTVILLGPDPKEVLPVLYLRLRHAIVNDGVRLIELTPTPTGLSRLAAASVHPTPGHTAEVVRALLDGDTAKAVGGVEPAVLATVAEMLRADGPVTVVLGRASLAEAAAVTVEAAAVLHDALPDAGFLPALRRANVFGALDMGLAPGLLPGRVALDEGREWFAQHWSSVPAERGLDATGILTAAADGHIDTLVLLGADPLADFPDADLAARALAGARTVIALDRFVTDSVAKADVVLPVAGFAECDGTTTNLEGRVSRVAKRVTAPGTARTDWTIAVDLADRLGMDLGFESVEEIWAEIESVSPAHSGITRAVLDQPGNADGVLAPPAAAEVAIALGAEPSGDEAVTPPDDPDAPGDAPSTDDAVDSAEAASDPELAADAAAEVASDVEDEAADADAADEIDDGPAAAVVSGRPTLLRFVAPDALAQPGPPDAYALRLVTTRSLYDHGTLLAHSPSLTALPPGPGLRLNPVDFDKVGVAPGAEVRVTAASGSVVLPVTAEASVPRGRAVVIVNQGGPRITELLDATATSVDVRVEVP